jgi:hypothetical protein
MARRTTHLVVAGEPWIKEELLTQLHLGRRRSVVLWLWRRHRQGSKAGLLRGSGLDYVGSPQQVKASAANRQRQQEEDAHHELLVSFVKSTE